MTKRMPAVFFGHGNPLNALSHNVYTEGWAAIGRALPRPRAILSISAHWYLPSTALTAMDQPETIHDFGGFPKELYEVQYRAPGSAALVKQVRSVLAPVVVKPDKTWGLDHGTWSVLKHVYPDADIPVVQLSINERQPPQFHYGLGKRLACLRDDGVLIMGSGNLVHNLHAYAWGRGNIEAYDWAVRFETKAREFLEAGVDGPLVEYEKLGRDALLSIPTPDHYLPLLYVIATRRPGERISFPVEGVDGGSVSMLACRIG
ncbi:MAG: 4,5-DOPA dioxygenase extradiol [Deltaproteobacteria bacterium]|nr:4,5-DOPA dioxygenase extradiol [Deltaproteobacteria bacterium]